VARIEGELKHGMRLGKERFKRFELHDHLTAGMIITAKEQAEKVVPFEVGGRSVPVVVESPARLGALMLCQQVAKIGPITGPLDYDLFAGLHQDDLDILNLYADLAAGALTAKALSERLTELGLHASPEVTHRGRHDSPGGEPGTDGGKSDQEGRGDEGHSGAEDGAA
jgi:phage FluMu protein gp41